MHRANNTEQGMIINRGVESSDNYGHLVTNSFFKKVNDYLICLLCNHKEKIRNNFTTKMHLSSRGHQKRYEEIRTALFNRPPSPSSVQMNSIRYYLSNLLNQNCLPPESYYNRDLIIQQFSYLLKSIDPQCDCRPLGSHVTRTALVHSNLNVELIHPNSKLFRSDPRAKNSLHHKLVDPDAEYGMQLNYHTTEYDLISNPMQSMFFVMRTFLNPYDVEFSRFFQIYSEHPDKDLNRRVPKLLLRHVETGVLMEICCYNDAAYELSELLRFYVTLDERARLLCCLVKYWANLCSIDKPDQGTYPPNAYMIMVIFYLQRTNPPILPCIHELVPSLGKQQTKNNVEPVKELTRKLESIKVSDNGSKAERPLTDSSESTSNGNENNSSNNQNQDTVDDEQDEDDEDELTPVHGQMSEIEECTKDWQSQNTHDVYYLFVDFMRTMMIEFEQDMMVLSIRTKNPLSSISKGWRGRIKPIENPIYRKVNLSKTIGSLRQFEYIKNCFKRAFYYLTSMPLDLRLKTDMEYKDDAQDYTKFYYHIGRMNNYFRMKWSNDLKPQGKIDVIPQMIQQDLFARDVGVINALYDRVSDNEMILYKSVANAYRKQSLIPKDHDAQKFCWLCKGHGHCRSNCSSNMIVTLQDELINYNVEMDSISDLDPFFLDLYQREAISPNLSKLHERITQELSQIIKLGLPHLKLKFERFGSTVNNMGSIDSDIDICMTIGENTTGHGVNCVEILRQVSDILRKANNVSRLEEVLTARVPILRFMYLKFEIDLSMYNHCAIYNSQLLRLYSTLDSRVPVLAYLVKRMAKTCGISDASRGSISSYAWSLLVIHFLQQIDQPILPVLQESDQSEVIGVSGWNVWFDKELKNWSATMNNLTITQLFKAFFLYYGCFNWDVYVISIRKSAKIARYNKSWNNCMMAIEDPFELTYNLASRLDDAMAIYIINSLANAYKQIIRAQRFQLEADLEPKTKKQTLYSFLFDKNAINDRDPPYRGCRVCHRIGHKEWSCPHKPPKFKKFTNNNEGK